MVFIDRIFSGMIILGENFFLVILGFLILELSFIFLLLLFCCIEVVFDKLFNKECFFFILEIVYFCG